ncbi:MAG: SPFH domain-containing protein [Planctomycetota bacterium]
MDSDDSSGARRPRGDFDPPWKSRGRGGRSDSPSPFKNLPPAARFASIFGGVLLVLLALLALTGRLGVMRVEANEAALRVNYLTGAETVITQPGYQFYVPFVMDVFKVDRQTQEYVMRDDRYRGLTIAPKLTVRANDGSNFEFGELKIQYEIIPGKVDGILQDSGPGEDYKREWIKAYARSILRDEFGRFSAVEVADPTTYKNAPEEARLRMNEALESHGIRVVRIITPNPTFDPKYERLIEERKVADQEVEELRARFEQLVQQKEQRLAAIRKEKDVEMQELQGALVRDLRASEQDAIRVKRAADAYATTRRAEGKALEGAKVAEAEGLTAKYTKEAEGIQARAEALAERGEVVVREALVEKLMGVKFTLVPYSRDPAPERLEHSGDRGGDERLVPSSDGGESR